MKVTLAGTEGPDVGSEFASVEHDASLVGGPKAEAMTGRLPAVRDAAPSPAGPRASPTPSRI